MASDARRLDQRHAQFRTASFLRDASGATLWSGRVCDGVNTFNIPLSAFRAVELRPDAPPRRHHAEDEVRDGWNGLIVL